MTETKQQHSYLQQTEFPQLHAEIAEQESIYSGLKLTVSSIEQALKAPEYQAVESIPFSNPSKKQKSEIAVAEKVTGFGNVIGEVFETLLTELGTLPTQEQFAEYGTALANDWWTKEGTGIDWSKTVEQAVYNRQLRSYSSHLVELHTLLSLRELFPNWKIYCSQSIDLLMGVDLVIETEQKRLFIHVFKNSRSAFSAYQKKQKRGGRRNSLGKFIKYHRDFSGDKSLQYDWSQRQTSESTQFINGNPLFKADYLKTQLSMFDKFKQFGSELEDYSKLQYLEQYLQELEVLDV